MAAVSGRRSGRSDAARQDVLGGVDGHGGERDDGRELGREGVVQRTPRKRHLQLLFLRATQHAQERHNNDSQHTTLSKGALRACVGCVFGEWYGSQRQT